MNRRRSRGLLARFTSRYFALKDWLGLVSEEERKRRLTPLIRLQRIRNRLRRDGFSRSNALSRRILIVNMIGLGVLVIGVLFLNQFRAGLIDQRVNSLETQGRIIGAAIADSAGIGAAGPQFDPVRLNLVVDTLARPAGGRARFFDRGGRLVADTERAGAQEAPETESAPDRWGRWISRFIAGEPELSGEESVPGLADESGVFAAMQDGAASWEQPNAEGEQILNVAVAVERTGELMGVLVLSTRGGDIDDAVSSERYVILMVFLVALVISVTLSRLLAKTIATPIRQLAEAAEAGGAREARPLNPHRIRLPDLSARPDEIGYLASALRRMTSALYERIDAIDQFAAEVAHEIKNPLTSLRSAVETMEIAKTPEMRARLLSVI